MTIDNYHAEHADYQSSATNYQLSIINHQLKKIMCEYTAKDYKKGQPRWCPGCGDHFFLASLHKAMAEIGKAPWENAVISGIGCSSRLPYYMNTYAMQTIHGRAAAISTGAKVANPNLTVWQISGDVTVWPSAVTTSSTPYAVTST